VNHVIDGRAALALVTILSGVSSANEQVVAASCHLVALFASALSKQLHDEKIELKDKLSDVFVLPHSNVDARWKLTDFLNVSRIAP
jgi:hypothetical protein